MRWICGIFLAMLAWGAFAQNTPTYRLCDGTIDGCPLVGQNNPFPTIAYGTQNLLTWQVMVGLSSTSVAPTRPGRRAITITNMTGSKAVYCTGVVDATIGVGQIISAIAGANFTFPTVVAMNCISDTTPQMVAVTETY